METIDVHEIKPTDMDYPKLIMRLLPKAEQYTLFSINGMTVVPLFQVFDALASIKPDTIKRNGIEYCANCGAKIKTDKEDNTDGVTNGDVIKAMFPHHDIEVNEQKNYVQVFYDSFYTTFPLRWWLEPYKAGDTK